MEDLQKYQEQADAVAPGRILLTKIIRVKGDKGYRKKAKFKDLFNGKDREYGNVSKLIRLLKKDPGYQFKESTPPTTTTDIPEKEEVVAVYQARAEAALPGRYTVIDIVEKRVRETSKGSTASSDYLFSLRDNERGVEFTYSSAWIRLLEKNPEHLFAATKKEKTKLHREALEKSGRVLHKGAGELADKLAKESDQSRGHIYNTLRRLGMEEGRKYLEEPRVGSVIEEAVAGWLTELKVVHRFNSVLEGTTYRPDFVIDESKLIIECDGLYWHSDANPRVTRRYHAQKKAAYLAQGYRSLFFRSDEIHNKPEVVKGIVTNALGLCQTRVGARKTEVVESMDPTFFKNNHLMGAGRGRKFYLVKDDKILAGIQVEPKRKDPGTLDVSRFCTAQGVSVPGGWSRLISHVIKEMSPERLSTFIDLRYGTGAHLAGMGWVKKTEHLSFGWTDGQDSFHRMKYRSNTGYEQGLYKIWDCGQAKWILGVNDHSPKEGTSRSPNTQSLKRNTRKVSDSSSVLRYQRRLDNMSLSTKYQILSCERRTTKNGKGYHFLTIKNIVKNDTFTFHAGSFIGALRKDPNHKFTYKFEENTDQDLITRYNNKIDKIGLGARYVVSKILERRQSSVEYYLLEVIDKDRNLMFHTVSGGLITALKKNPNHNFRRSTSL